MAGNKTHHTSSFSLHTWVDSVSLHGLNWVHYNVVILITTYFPQLQVQANQTVVFAFTLDSTRHYFPSVVQGKRGNIYLAVHKCAKLLHEHLESLGFGCHSKLLLCATLWLMCWPGALSWAVRTYKELSKDRWTYITSAVVALLTLFARFMIFTLMPGIMNLTMILLALELSLHIPDSSHNYSTLKGNFHNPGVQPLYFSDSASGHLAFTAHQVNNNPSTWEHNCQSSAWQSY